MSAGGCASRVMRTRLALLLACASAAPAWAGPPALDVLLTPAAPEAGRIGHVEVAITLPAPSDGSTALARMPLVASNVETVATVIAVTARDARGPLPLTVRHEGPADTGTRHWHAARPPEGAVTLRYRAPVPDGPGARGAAPPLELSGVSGALSGAGSTFLLLPENAETHRLTVDWDLSALPDGARGVTSLGPAGTVTASPDRLARAFFMAGAIGAYPDGPAHGPFFAAWQGAPPFAPAPLMAWTEALHQRFVRFFRIDAPEPYGVFLRHNPVNAGGGVSLAGAFVATYGEATEAERLKITLSHEMFHTFAPAIADPGGLESSWFGEGLAVHYARALALRFGAIDADAFLADLNFHAGRFYTSARADTPNADIPAGFWADTRVRTLPYDRGSLYFGMVDDSIRKASGGARSLDDLVLALAARHRAGERLSDADWEALLRAELGEEAVADFHAMLAGRPPLPAFDAYGPCFRRITVPLRRYELGFAPAVLTEPRRIVRGLVPGSAAAEAGLRDGDEILRPVPQDHLQGNQTATLTLHIGRDGQQHSITYLPRGETVDAYQWEFATERTPADCAL